MYYIFERYFMIKYLFLILKICNSINVFIEVLFFFIYNRCRLFIFNLEFKIDKYMVYNYIYIY